jgi:hypothetical protein
VEEENRQLSVCVLARWLGVTDKTVRELVKADIAVRAERGLYRLEESVRRYSEHIRQTASQWGGEASLEAIRDALGLKNAAARGELLEAAAVEAEWSSVLRTVRAGILAVPSRAGARLPHLTPGAALAEVGDADERGGSTSKGHFASSRGRSGPVQPIDETTLVALAFGILCTNSLGFRGVQTSLASGVKRLSNSLTQLLMPA